MAEELSYDGSISFLGGQDASKIPSRVPEDSYFAGVNISVSKGVPTPRWGNRRKNLKFTTDKVKVPGQSNVQVTLESVFRSGRYQAAIPYLIGDRFYLLLIISGIIFLVDQDTFEVSTIEIPGPDYLNENMTRIAWSQAGRFLVLHDFPNVPVVVEGATARRADPAADEVPISTMSAYNENRLFITNAGSEFTGGDPTGSLAKPDAPITFSEVLQPAAPFFGQIFQMPTGYGNEPLTAMAFLQTTDTSTGIGPLLISTANAIYSFQTQNPRSAWENGPFGTLFVANAGIAGLRSFVNVNSDLFFLSSDGQVRSASMSRDEQKRWARIPISKEVQNWLKYWDRSLIPYGVLGYFQNKIFISANPFRTEALHFNRIPTFDVAHGGMVVLELDNMASLGQDSPPAWAGLWTGMRPMDFVVNNGHCFVMSKDEAFSNQLYEIDPSLTYDVDDKTGDIRQIVSILYTREFDFKSPFQNKDLYSLDLGVQDVQGDFTVDVKFKPSQGSMFVPWGVFTHIAPWRVCEVPQTCDVNGLSSHNFKDLTLGSPVGERVCDPVGNSFYGNFREVQLKITLTGAYWELQGFRLKAKTIPQNERETACGVFNSVSICKDCTVDDWSVGAFKSCQSLQT